MKLICEAVLAERELDGRDGEDVVCGFGRGGAKEASHSSDCVILGDLQVSEGGLGNAVGPDGGSEGEDGEDDGVIYLSPIEEVESTYGVAKELEGSDGRSPACCHGVDVCVPLEVMLEKNPQVPNRVRSPHREDPAAREAQREGGYLCSNVTGGGLGGLEADILCFIHIYAKAVAG